MKGTRPTYQLLDAFVDAMTGGRAPTAPTFVCPICEGPATASASRAGDALSVSIRCPCSAMALDRVPRWPGWEALLSAPPAGFVANPLGLARGTRAGVGYAFDRPRPAGRVVPCPHCGAPLATAAARQCFVCGTDWHDPARVVCRGNPRRNPHGLAWRSSYAAELCHGPAGDRYVRYREAAGGTPDPHAAFETPAHPGWRWVAWGEPGFAGEVETTTGEAFAFAAGGVWLTWDEVRGLHRHARGAVALADVPWSTATPPALPPW